ncbi:MAG TPA: hypothetical protein PLV25_04135, partial [Opitutales bacterium]|nr:hypothetical protein [Opitutales bacterium]
MSRALIGTARMTALIAGVVLAFGVLMGRLSYLHVWEQDRLGRIVERNRQKFEVLQARRGNILDAKGQLLATTRTVIELGIDPQLVNIENRSQLIALSRLIQVSVPVLEATIQKKVVEVHSEDGSEIRLVRWAKLCDAIDEPTYQKVLAMGIKGVYGNRKFERTYPGSKTAAHVLG